MYHRCALFDPQKIDANWEFECKGIGGAEVVSMILIWSFWTAKVTMISVHFWERVPSKQIDAVDGD